MYIYFNLKTSVKTAAIYLVFLRIRFIIYLCIYTQTKQSTFIWNIELKKTPWAK
jgi:hypothetical protein